RVAKTCRLPGRHGGRCFANAPFELQTHAGGAVTDLVDDEELAVASIAEVVLQDRARALRVGSRDRERVREQRGQPGRRKAAREQDNEPESENRPPEAQDETGPAGHASTLVALGTLGLWTNHAISSTQRRRSSSSSPTSGRSSRSRAACGADTGRRSTSSAARSRRY